ncbi:MAG: ABC transporter ATP-binding protein [Anaerolineae bacterium]|nr:ABC transporter ATP-binding protein [Thermoflexales bacterium]MDW8406777.1 ABC transporter ATP-binding protein [Anaerolineae bacterium]
MLAATDLVKSYGVRPVLRGVSLGAGPGECVAVLGANGAGKTTLLRVLATLSKPEGGLLSVNGIDALQHPDQARRLIGFVSHQPLVYPDLTGYENLLFYARLYGVDKQPMTSRHMLQTEHPFEGADSQRLGRDARLHIEALLRRVNLHLRAHDLTRTYSRGMLQRLAIARALIHDPVVILLDEPFTGLDQASARALSALLGEWMAAGKTLVMTTHEFARGLEGVTRAVLLRHGRIADEMSGDITPARLASWFE